MDKNIAWSKTPAWGRGFKFEPNPIQLTCGVASTHYRNSDTVNVVKLPGNAKSLHIKGNICIIAHLENEKIKHHWCYIDGLNFEMCKETEEIFSFAVKQTPGSSFVFVPKDGKVENVHRSRNCF